jgi:hypothetical protein
VAQAGTAAAGCALAMFESRTTAVAAIIKENRLDRLMFAPKIEIYD